MPGDTAAGSAWGVLVNKAAPVLRARGSSGSAAVVLTMQGEPLVNAGSLSDLAKREATPCRRVLRGSRAPLPPPAADGPPPFVARS